MSKTVVPIFNDEYRVVVFFGASERALKLAVKMGHEPHNLSWDSQRGVTFFTHGVTPVIAMPRKPKTPQEFGTLAHEACHAVEILFNYIDQPTTGEVFAHSVGAVVRLAMQKD